MKRFINNSTGIIEAVTNERLIEQYEKHSEAYAELKDVTAAPQPKRKPAVRGR